MQGTTIKARSDCGTGCYTDLGTAEVYMGNSYWQGPSSRDYYTFCGTVPTNVARGSSITVACSSPVIARYVAVYLPKNATALTLCEVDVIAV